MQVKLDRAWGIFRREHVLETFTIALCLGSIALGLVLALDTDVRLANGFRIALDWAPAPTWGWLLIAPSLGTIVSLVSKRRDIYWPLFGIAAWYAAWGVAATINAPGDKVVGTAAAVYTTMCVLSAIPTLAFYLEQRDSS